jgi:hypothetical protein
MKSNGKLNKQMGKELDRISIGLRVTAVRWSWLYLVTREMPVSIFVSKHILSGKAASTNS